LPYHPGPALRSGGPVLPRLGLRLRIGHTPHTPPYKPSHHFTPHYNPLFLATAVSGAMSHERQRWRWRRRRRMMPRPWFPGPIWLVSLRGARSILIESSQAIAQARDPDCATQKKYYAILWWGAILRYLPLIAEMFLENSPNAIIHPLFGSASKSIHIAAATKLLRTLIPPTSAKSSATNVPLLQQTPSGPR
jgi:hypothetical protein